MLPSAYEDEFLTYPENALLPFAQHRFVQISPCKYGRCSSQKHEIVASKNTIFQVVRLSV